LWFDRHSATRAPSTKAHYVTSCIVYHTLISLRLVRLQHRRRHLPLVTRANTLGHTKRTTMSACHASHPAPRTHRILHHAAVITRLRRKRDDLPYCLSHYHTRSTTPIGHTTSPYSMSHLDLPHSAAAPSTTCPFCRSRVPGARRVPRRYSRLPDPMRPVPKLACTALRLTHCVLCAMIMCACVVLASVLMFECVFLRVHSRRSYYPIAKGEVPVERSVAAKLHWRACVRAVRVCVCVC
jgi:hypothetical protein